MTMIRWVVDVPRWLFLASLVFAPWAYGCTRSWAISSLEVILSVVLLLWTGDLIVRRRLPATPPLLLFSAAGILLLGWWMAINAHSLYDEEYSQFASIISILPGAPGAVERDLSRKMMLRVTMLLGALLFSSDLAKRRVWQNRLWTTISLTGLSMVAFGITQKITRESFLTWELPGPAWTYFATFRYHGNAGAYINLVWPLVAGKAISSFRPSRATENTSRAFWLGAAVVCLASNFINFSRASMAIALGLTISIGGWTLIRNFNAICRNSSAVIGAVAAAAIGLIVAVGSQVPWHRWEGLVHGDRTELSPRMLVSATCLRMIPDSGVFGFGPGTWAAAFPPYAQAPASGVQGVWRYAHEDYLQTVIEWGYVGTLFWAILFAGGTALCIINATRQSGDAKILLMTAGLSLCGIALHALIDFPLQIASLQLYVAVYLGLGWGSNEWRGMRPRHRVEAAKG